MNWLILNCLTGIYSICSIQIFPHVFCWDLRHLQHSNIPPPFLLGSTPFAAFKYPPPDFCWYLRRLQHSNTPPVFDGIYAICSIQILPPPPVFCWDLRHLQHSNIPHPPFFAGIYAICSIQIPPPPVFCWDLRHLQHSNIPPPVSIKISPPPVFCWDLRHLQHLNIPPSLFCWDLLYAICSILIPPPPPPFFDGIYTICSIQIPPARFLLGSTPFAAFKYHPFSCWDLRHLQHSNTPPSFFKYPLPFFAGIYAICSIQISPPPPFLLCMCTLPLTVQHTRPDSTNYKFTCLI